MHAFFEYAPLLVFFIVWKIAGIYWATGSLIITSAIQIIYYFIKKEKVPTRNWVLFGLILVFGGMTIIFQDDLFLKWKVTIINALFAIVLVVSNTFFNKNFIKNLMGEALELPEPIWNKLNLSWAVFFLICAVLNIYIAYNYSQDIWVNFKVFGLTAMTFIFAIGSVIMLYKYLPAEEESDKTNENIENK